MSLPQFVVRAVSILVPAPLREEWRTEWEAELAHAWHTARRSGAPAGLVRMRLLVRATGSAGDALWLRARHGGLYRPAPLLRDAVRALVRRPGYALTVIGTLALGMGSATAIFTVVDALFVRPIPFHEPERLVSLSTSPRSVRTLDAEELREWRRQERVFAQVRAYRPSNFILTGAGEARIELGWLVEPGFLELLGVRPAIGRGLTPSDAQPGSDRVVLLADELWRSAFGGDPDVVGRIVELDGEPHTVIGVLPPTLRRLPVGIVGMVLPLSDAEPALAMARLQPGLPLAAARARLEGVARALSDERPREEGWSVGLMPLQRIERPALRNGLLALAGGVLCLLLIACANAAGLLLLRGVSRRGELQLRLALGAPRGSLLLQVLMESLALAMAAGLVGALLAWLCVRGLVALLPSGVVRFSYTVISIDERVLLFAFGLTLLTGVLFGVIPASRAARTSLVRIGHTSTATRQDVRLRSVAQVVQLALAVLLLAGAGLFARSFLQIMSIPLGYDVDRLLRLELVSLERLRGREATAELARSLDEGLRALPGVAAVGRGGISLWMFDYTIQTEDGQPRASGADRLTHARVDTAYFRTMGIPLREGRAFDARDLSPTASSVILDRDLAGALWPDRSAVGRSFRITQEDEGRWLRVVGVAGDVKLEGPRDPSGRYLLFHPANAEELRNGTIVLRTPGDPRALAPAVRQVVRALDPGQPIGTLETGREAVAETVADPRLFLVVMVALAAIALTLAVVGVYGLVSFAVEQGKREIAIRVALGAHARTVVAGVVRWGLVLGALGIAIGLSATVLLGRFVEAILYGTSPLEPAVLLLASGVLLVACAGALVRPAFRAAGTDPAEVLRAE